MWVNQITERHRCGNNLADGSNCDVNSLPCPQNGLTQCAVRLLDEGSFIEEGYSNGKPRPSALDGYRALAYAGVSSLRALR